MREAPPRADRARLIQGQVERHLIGIIELFRPVEQDAQQSCELDARRITVEVDGAN